MLCKLGRCEPKLSGTTGRRQYCSTVVVVDVVTSSRVGIVGSNLGQTELVVGLCGVAGIDHQKLCVSI